MNANLSIEHSSPERLVNKGDAEVYHCEMDIAFTGPSSRSWMGACAPMFSIYKRVAPSHWHGIGTSGTSADALSESLDAGAAA